MERALLLLLIELLLVYEGKHAMIRSGKFCAALVLSLVLSLALLTTGAFAQDTNQSIGRGNISVSAHVAVVTSIMHGATSAVLGNTIQRPDGVRGNCRNWGWGNGCHGFNGCQGWNNCWRPRPSFRCTSQRECRSIQVCHWTRWGRVCQGVKTCRFRSICRRCFNNGWNGGWGNGWRGGWNGGWSGGVHAWGTKGH